MSRVPGKLKELPWWTWVVGVNVLLTLNTAIYMYLPDFPARGYLEHFLLSMESNLATWWSTISLFIVGCLAYEISFNAKRKLQKAWITISALFIVLSVDELGSLHERLGSGGMSSYLPYAAIGVALLVYALAPLFRDKQSRLSALFILLGFVTFGSVVVQEYFEHTIDWPYWLQGLRFGVEEGSELLGIFLCLLAVVRQRQTYLQSSSIATIIPNPWRAKFLPYLLMGGIAAHFGASLYAASYLQDVDFVARGNPAVWYPSVVAFLLFSALTWSFIEFRKHASWLLLAAYLLISSALIVDPMSLFGLNQQFYLNYFFQILVIGLVLFYSEYRKSEVKYEFLLLLSIVSNLGLLGMVVDSVLAQYLLSGILYYCLLQTVIKVSRTSLKSGDELPNHPMIRMRASAGEAAPTLVPPAE